MRHSTIVLLIIAALGVAACNYKLSGKVSYGDITFEPVFEGKL